MDYLLFTNFWKFRRIFSKKNWKCFEGVDGNKMRLKWNERRCSITFDEETTTHCHQRDWQNEYWVTLSAICLFHIKRTCWTPCAFSFASHKHCLCLSRFLLYIYDVFFFLLNVSFNRWQLSEFMHNMLRSVTKKSMRKVDVCFIF